MKVGDLVRIKENVNAQLTGRLAIIINMGTWSADIHFLDKDDAWEPRIALELLEKIA